MHYIITVIRKPHKYYFVIFRAPIALSSLGYSGPISFAQIVVILSSGILALGK